MKKLFILIAVSILALSCSTNDEQPLPGSSTTRTVQLSILSELITPMNGAEHSAKDGAIKEGYHLVVTDANGEKSPIEFNLNDLSIEIKDVTGSFDVKAYHPDAGNRIDNIYYISGEATGTSSDESIQLNMSNENYAYIVVDGSQDEVISAKINSFSMLPTSDVANPNFYAYVMVNNNYDLKIETSRGLVTQMITPNADYAYTYTVDFSTKTIIGVELGFDGTPKDTPIYIPNVPVENLSGVKSYSITEEGYVVGTSKDNSRATIFSKVSGDKYFHQYDFNFDVSTEDNYSFMNIYVKKANAGWGEPTIRISYYTESSNTNLQGKYMTNEAGFENEMYTKEEIVEKYTNYLVIQFMDGVNVGNFFWRTGDSDDHAESFTIRNISIDDSKSVDAYALIRAGEEYVTIDYSNERIGLTGISDLTAEGFPTMRFDNGSDQDIEVKLWLYKGEFETTQIVPAHSQAFFAVPTKGTYKASYIDPITGEEVTATKNN
ncbi:hypothetical protein [Flammeovirga pacifica]|uniref:Uncharacterized protein n=1 Tax=Flammeovirga pacifica TaxID=915059 RepID=A0A1S1Z2V4_FLAPC|nr:hypothetical protein [Flammeovirga pacifica]OHX67562.1 hypothetical protein NH26_15005 [Flammeovirga pacifica]